jgi:hypothetical protein
MLSVLPDGGGQFTYKTEVLLHVKSVVPEGQSAGNVVLRSKLKDSPQHIESLAGLVIVGTGITSTVRLDVPRHVYAPLDEIV